MSWNFEIEGKCDLFRVTRGIAGPGDELAMQVTGEPVGEGFVRSPNVTAVVSGKLRSEYEGHDPYVIEGFGYSCPHHPDQQVAPAGMAIAVAETPVDYICVTPKPGKKLDHQWEQLPMRVANGPDVEPYTFKFRKNVYMVVVDGQVDVNGKIINKNKIGRAKSFVVDPIVPSIIVFIWER